MAQNLFTIAPHAPFLPTLANAVLNGPLLGDWPRDDPFWLADVTIILPTRRAQLALQSAFALACDGATILPEIRTFGGEAAEEELFLAPYQAEPFPRSISPLARRLYLAHLIDRWLRVNSPEQLIEGLPAKDFGDINPIETLHLADALATLIDDFQTEEVSSDTLRNVAPDELGAYWQSSLKFLEIVMTNWPSVLDELQSVDASALRNLRLRRQAETAALLYGNRPVIAAGSTGSIPATAQLMRTLAGLPRGALVLPGLDTKLTPDQIEQLTDPSSSPHGHPQYGLSGLLKRIGARAGNVTELAPQPTHIRSDLVRHALALAKDTSLWHQARAGWSEQSIFDATQNIAIAAARTEQEQARVIALAARQALAAQQVLAANQASVTKQGGGTIVGIIAPDRTLARRIAAELKRFNIEVDDSAGAPLLLSRAGRLTRQVLVACTSNIAPVDLIALLRNRYVSLGRSRADLARLTEWIEFGLLRGQRPALGFEGLRQATNENEQGLTQHISHRLTEQQSAEILSLLDDLEQALKPLQSVLAAPFTAPQLAAALMTGLEALRITPADETTPPMAGQDELRAWADALQNSPNPGPPLNAFSAEDALASLMAGSSVRNNRPGRADVAIWGRLEARLQTADLLILTALNEGSWPEIADPGPFLSRGMRMAAGLEPPERQHGLAAHDFEMAMGNSKLLLTYSLRSGTAPATQSRLLQRFLGLVGEKARDEMLARGNVWVELAQGLDQHHGDIAPAARPLPSPPASTRTRRLSVTEVEALIRSPYDIYAKHTLGLRKLDPLGEDAGARERGNIIHEIFAQFVEADHDPLASQALEILSGLAENNFAKLEHTPERRDIWLRRFHTSAQGFLAFERDRADRVDHRFAEQRLEWKFDVAGTQIVLHGRADRIDRMKGGSIEIIDFKTGSIPSSSEMKNFLAPQLLLEALMVGHAGFGDQPAASVSALQYIKIGAGPAAFEQSGFQLPTNMDLPTAQDAIFRHLQNHIEALLLSDSQPMTASLLPKTNQRFKGDYEHLARTDEWASTPSEGDAS